MRILCVGGGSGGHITPIVAVINKLLDNPSPDELRSSALHARRGSNGDAETYDIRVWCDRKFAPQAKKLLADTNVRVDIIAAGKLRRYANLKWWYRWFSPYHIIHTFRISSTCSKLWVALFSRYLKCWFGDRMWSFVKAAMLACRWG